LFKIGRDTTGNLPPLPAIFPDQMAPVVRVSEGESKSGRGGPSALWLSDDRTEQCRRPDPPKGDAGHIDDAGGMGRVDARAVGGGRSVKATLARRYAKYHCEGRAG